MYIGNINDYTQTDRIQKSTLFKEHRFHVITIHLPEHEMLKTHHSTTDAFLFVQKGRIQFELESEKFTLEEGALFTFQAFQKHSVVALQDTCLLIVK